MPIQLEIFHPDRIAVGVARGEITLQEFVDFATAMVKADVVHYRKIFEVTAATSMAVGKDELLAMDERLRQVTQKGPRGPLAIVADGNRGELAQTFKALSSSDRPVEVFRSIHEARKWLATYPIAM